MDVEGEEDRFSETLDSPDIENEIECSDERCFTPPEDCLLYTSPSPRDRQKSRMPSSA